MDFVRTDDVDRALDDEDVVGLPEVYPYRADVYWKQVVFAVRQIGCLVLEAYVHLEVGVLALGAHVDPEVIAS